MLDDLLPFSKRPIPPLENASAFLFSFPCGLYRQTPAGNKLPERDAVDPKNAGNRTLGDLLLQQFCDDDLFARQLGGF